MGLRNGAEQGPPQLQDQQQMLYFWDLFGMLLVDKPHGATLTEFVGQPYIAHYEPHARAAAVDGSIEQRMVVHQLTDARQ